MIATGTDIKPLEIVMFLRDVRSAVYYEQMKGRGTRVIDPHVCALSRLTRRPRPISCSWTRWA